jgi:D-alanyl-D-alanine carboxypeptidase/D-alanyl-D-alanine-endopeptidase (penicillin-binding protein 4)
MVHRSPSLDSINHWFLQKSVNLYGEALVHTISLKRKGRASFDGGVDELRDFWAGKGIDRRAVGIVDGSGLSPQNRVTAEALTRALRYAMGRPWFPAFDKAMPVHSGIRMKSGTMGGVRSYAGYIKGRDGREYVFAVIVNNFSGSGATLNRKLWDLLEALK